VAAVSDPSITGVAADWGELFHRHARTVFAAAYRITRSSADAEDILQVIFLRLLRRPPDAPVLADPAAYLHCAAVHAALDCLRGRVAAAWVPIEAGPEPAAPGGDGGDLAEALRAALARLAPRTAEVFTLRHIEGMSNSQIAGLLGLTPVHVAVLLHRARRQLQRELRSFRGGL